MARVDYIDDANAPRTTVWFRPLLPAVQDVQGRFLKIHTTDNDLWALPGGGHEIGESIADTVVREVKR